MKRKIERMRELYGSLPGHKCGECSNFVSGRYNDRILRKCERYGLTHSEASDWAWKWEACGMFNVPLPLSERPVIEWPRARERDYAPLEGQITMEDYQE